MSNDDDYCPLASSSSSVRWGPRVERARCGQSQKSRSHAQDQTNQHMLRRFSLGYTWLTHTMLQPACPPAFCWQHTYQELHRPNHTRQHTLSLCINWGGGTRTKQQGGLQIEEQSISVRKANNVFNEIAENLYQRINSALHVFCVERYDSDMFE